MLGSLAGSVAVAKDDSRNVPTCANQASTITALGPSCDNSPAICFSLEGDPTQHPVSTQCSDHHGIGAHWYEM